MAVEAYFSGWPLSSWISPGAAFFLFVNVLIGAIVVTSRGHHHHQGGRAASSKRRLCRSASSMFLDRLRSFSIFSSAVHPAVVPVEMEAEYYSMASTELELEADELEQRQHQPAAAVAGLARSPVAAAVADPVADVGASSEIATEAGQDMSTCCLDDNAAHGLVLQHGHGRRQSVDVVTADEASAAATVESQSHEEKLAGTTSMRQRAPACRREAEEEALEGKAALNARAESFIRRFREDLKLERLNSIINYTRTLRSGTGAASPTAQ